MKTTKEERDLINAIHKKRHVEQTVDREFAIFQEMLPALRQIIKNGGTADQLLKKSGSLAAYKLIQLMHSDKEEVALKASEKVLSYDVGKPVERSINIYGDMTRMNEKDLDAQIMLLLENTGAKKLLKDTGTVPKKFLKKQKRKPRLTDEQTIDADYTVRQEGSSEQAAEVEPSAETGTPSES